MTAPNAMLVFTIVFGAGVTAVVVLAAGAPIRIRVPLLLCIFATLVAVLAAVLGALWQSPIGWLAVPATCSAIAAGTAAGIAAWEAE